MAVLIDDTVTGEYANSYVDIDYADEFFESHWSTAKADAWDALDDDPKQMLLVQATQLIEQIRFTYYEDILAFYQLRYDYITGKVISRVNFTEPIKYLFTQKLQFPRNLDVDKTTTNPYIPEPIKMAQCEQAITLATFNDASLIKILGGIKSEDVQIAGQIKKAVVYQDAMVIGAGNSLSPLTIQLLSPYILKTTRFRRS